MANSDTRQIVPPPTPMRITQIAVVVRDMEAALKSYTETMGWAVATLSTSSRPACTHD
jgi:predicted enzyme related to lactoylglutathione lyase